MNHSQNQRSKKFYREKYASGEYTQKTKPEDNKEYQGIKKFIAANPGILQTTVFELGCGKGFFQGLFSDYVGLDIVEGLKVHFSKDKKFVVGTGNRLPFKKNSFGFLFSIHTLEHVPEPGDVLREIRRVVKDEGLVYLAPAWQCRSWAAHGYPVRPYSDFKLWGKIIKFSIPLRNSLLWRSLFIFPKRLFGLLRFLITGKPVLLFYKKLKPNLDVKWMSDSDAFNSMDPFLVILWFMSRGDSCLNYPGLLKALFVRTGALTLKVNKK